MLPRASVKSLGAILIAACLCVAASRWLKPVDPPGELAPAEPVQVMIDANPPAFSRAGWDIHALATYDITARLLHKKRYYSPPAASLVPYDFAVGWGPMSDNDVIRRIDMSQSNRFYFWEYHGAPPIPEDQIICHSANMHLIPASGAVERALWWASPGDIVHLTGYLVQATYPGCGPWRSSLSRTDTGNGACELMYVQSCEFLAPPANAQPVLAAHLP